MGVYDSVKVPCPGCGEEQWCQSKSGPCELKEFPLSSAPDDVMLNVNRHAPFQCEACWEYFYVDVQTRTPRFIPRPWESGGE
jgi:phage terminase large subunit GpA-like protein